jgi:hypothetical protein
MYQLFVRVCVCVGGMASIPPPPPLDGYGGGIPQPPSGGPSLAPTPSSSIASPSSSMNGAHGISSEGKGSLPSLEPQLTNIQPIPIK